LGDQPATHAALEDGDRIQLGRTTILKFTLHDQVEETFQRQQYESAVRDPLTHLYNRRHFTDRLKMEFAFAERHRTPLAIILFDLDYFKKINDTYGHLAGDFVLSSVGAAVSRMCRAEDVLARYGGEEFVIIVRGISGDNVRKFCERIRSTVDRLAVDWESSRIGVTVSVGLATMEGGVTFASPEALVATADANLYKAKESGRNRVQG
jgi:diguanylate cyclase (GGDEF)-like protein